MTCRCTASGEAGGAALLVGDFTAAAGVCAKADMHEACTIANLALTLAVQMLSEEQASQK